MKLSPVSGLSFLLLAGCAGMTEELQTASAHSIGVVVTEEVTIANVERLPGALAWNALTNSRRYKCKTTDKPENARCVEF
jgi:hypothetical protein